MHFDDLDDLQSILADELAREFDDLLQPRRLSLDDPIERIAAGCGAFINQALHDPAWGALIARGAAAMPDIARCRTRAAQRGHPPSGGDWAPCTTLRRDLAFEFVLGITGTNDAIGCGRSGSSPSTRPRIVAGILRAIGVTAEEAQDIAFRLAILVVRNPDTCEGPGTMPRG